MCERVRVIGSGGDLALAGLVLGMVEGLDLVGFATVVVGIGIDDGDGDGDDDDAADAAEAVVAVVELEVIEDVAGEAKAATNANGDILAFLMEAEEVTLSFAAGNSALVMGSSVGRLGRTTFGFGEYFDEVDLVVLVLVLGVIRLLAELEGVEMVGMLERLEREAGSMGAAADKAAAGIEAEVACSVEVG